MTSKALPMTGQMTRYPSTLFSHTRLLSLPSFCAEALGHISCSNLYFYALVPPLGPSGLCG